MWVLLAVALAIVITAAFVDDITFAGHTFKKAPIADLFVDKSVGKADTIAVDSVPVNMKEEVTTDSLPQSLLIFGDSMTYNLALRLAQYAKQNGHIIHAINWDSSNTKIWAEHDTLQYYIRQFRPTQIFISLGSNELYFKNPESRTPYVKKIIEVIDTVPFVWIGPPNWKEDSGINDMLARICGPGRFFSFGRYGIQAESGSYTPYTTEFRSLDRQHHEVAAKIRTPVSGGNSIRFRGKGESQYRFPESA